MSPRCFAGAKDNVLARKCLSLDQAKGFVSRLYSVLLLAICLVPSTPVRFLLMAGSITTFLYTQHIKVGHLLLLWLRRCLAMEIRGWQLPANCHWQIATGKLPLAIHCHPYPCQP